MGPGAVLALLGVHLVLALAAGGLFKRLGRRAFLLLAFAPAALLAWSVFAASRIVAGEPVRESLRWMPSLHFELSVRVDGFSLLMLALVSGIGLLVLGYCASYFGERDDLGRIGGLLLAFSAAMAGVVVSDNLMAIFLFWELTSYTSYLLIGVEDRSATARAGATRALVTTGAGGLALFAGFVLVAQGAGTWSLAEILADPPRGASVNAALVLILIGAFTKSAQFPFHYWLPGAMVAPTPVSAYLHSATMVKAGVYLIARLAPSFADVAFWRPLVVSVGAVTMILGGWKALAQNDLKVLLAHGTTSQLGFMVVLFGLGHDDAVLAGAALLLAHGLFKATLFMVVGIVDHQAHTRDVRRLSRLWDSMPKTTTLAVISAASMAGLPPLIGFVAKEEAFTSLVTRGGGAGAAAAVAVVIGSILTFAYSARFVWGMVGPETPGIAAAKGEVQVPAEASWNLLAAPGVLGVLTVLGGIVPASMSRLVVDAARALQPALGHVSLSLWHGFNQALLLSGIVISAGLVMFVTRDGVDRLRERLPHPASGGRVFDLGLARLLRGSDVLIGRIQTGSLPWYLVIIFTTALVIPAVSLLIGSRNSVDWVLLDRPGQLVTVVLMAVASVGAVALRHRLAAAMCVGAVGYGIAVMFMFQGAPDLALTQMMVETLVLVVFVLVMRHLPSKFARNQTAFAVFPRALLSVLVGVGAAIFALVAFAARPDGVMSVSESFVASSPKAGGSNIVNAILVEFRAFDTLGETSVLTVTALGVLGLVRATRRERRRTASVELAPLRPSFVLDSAVHALFRPVILISLILLLSGHDEPGGGFIAGLVAGSAFMLLYLAGGERSLRSREPLAAEVFLGVGITVVVLAGAIGWFTGGVFLESAALAFDLPALGHIKVSSTLLFDAGVYLAVIGLVLALLRSLGREEVHQL